MQFRIALAGGGTGGHVMPLIAVAREIRSRTPDTRIRFIGPLPFGADLFAAEQIELGRIAAGKVPRYFTPKFFMEIAKIPVGFAMALWQLFMYMPDIVIGKGGYGMLPVAVVAWLYRIPVIIHESDAVAGLATRLAARFAKVVLVSFPETRGLPKGIATQLVGNPIRTTVTQGDRQRAQSRFRLGLHPVVLVLGGSQGAEQINNLMLRIAPELLRDAEVIHQVGAAHEDIFKRELEQVLQAYPGTEQLYHAYGFLNEEELEDAYAAATVTVSRAGAALIFELAAVGMPTILIPLETAAANHQYVNAEQLLNNDMVLLLSGKELTPNLLLDQIRWLLQNEDLRREFSDRFRTFARPESAGLIAQLVLEYAQANINRSLGKT
jgi:UDP-N-acetylglucosamine--N-acetylmuramyl-(pentapeptide) pyrophosphoryl-undecaprenol N-acetylglucosamine transferase